METAEITGIAASVFTSSTLIPQLIKILKEKKADGTSILMLLVLFTGLSLWVAYGVMKNDLIIIVANSFSLLVNTVTLFARVRYR